MKVKIHYDRDSVYACIDEVYLLGISYSNAT